jgi:ComF family protein
MATLAGLSKMFSWPPAADFLSLFFPNFCQGCQGNMVKGEEILCTKCLADIPYLNYYGLEDNPIVNRFVGRAQIKHGWAMLKFHKAGLVQNLLHQIKYNNRPEIGERLGKIFAVNVALHGFETEFDLLIPVPLHKNKKRTRGYNQSEMIAKGMAEVLHIPHSDSVVERLTATATQTKKSRIERWENVNFAFRVMDRSQISGRRILIVDDVITTGATIEACAKCLLEAGAAEISVACLAEA